VSSAREVPSITPATARTWVEIDLGRIANNIRALKTRLPAATGVLMTVKANAYGHGLVPVARRAIEAGVWGLGVAALDEAAELRAAGITAPIVALMPILPDEAARAIDLEVIASITDWEQASALAQRARAVGQRVPVHVEVDTGMGRAGVREDDAAELIVRIDAELRELYVDGIFTHFASADEADTRFTERQLDRFDALLATLAERGIQPAHVHVANSAAALRLRRAARTLVRPGIALYGAAGEIAAGGDTGWGGFDGWRSSDDEAAFVPALAWRVRVVGVKSLEPGDAVSYHRLYVAKQPERVAILAVGYGDGWPFSLSNRGSVLLRGRVTPIRGAVCMDLTMVDATPFTGLVVGEVATLIGRQGEGVRTVEEVGREAGLMSYAILTGIGPRVPRVYVES
jgi:alanine racemase